MLILEYSESWLSMFYKLSTLLVEHLHQDNIQLLLNIISKIIDAKDAETTYTYDNLDRLLSVNKTEGTNNYQNTYTYENDNLKTIGHNGFNYSFIYDKFNNVQQVKIGEQSLIQNTYEAGNGNLTKATYGNGHEISYLYDNFNRVSRKTGTDGNIDYEYDGRNNLAKVQDGVNNETITYTYDLADRLVQIQNSNLFKTKYTYDNNSNVNSRKYLLNELEETINYKYDRDNRINYLSLSNAKDLFYHYDIIRFEKDFRSILLLQQSLVHFHQKFASSLVLS